MDTPRSQEEILAALSEAREELSTSLAHDNASAVA